MSRSRSRSGQVKPKVQPSSVASIIIIAIAVNQSIDQAVNQSITVISLLSPTGLVILPYSHSSDPRAQAGAVRILPVSRSLYLQTAIDKSRHVQTAGG